MELKIKAKLSNISDVEKLMEKIRAIEKEHSCNCTLVEIEIA
jgi:hypothetical protein